MDEFALLAKLNAISDDQDNEDDEKDNPNINVPKPQIDKPEVSDHPQEDFGSGIYDIPESIVTKRSPVSMLNSDLVKINIVEVIPKVSKSIFKSAQNAYVVNTIPYGWKVQREYKDLVFYRDAIHKQFPGDIVTFINI